MIILDNLGHMYKKLHVEPRRDDTASPMLSQE